MPVRLDDAFYDDLDDRLAASDDARRRAYPGESGRRQPVHTAYIPADSYHRDVASEWGATATSMMDEHLREDSALAEVLDIAPDLAAQIRPLVTAKLAAQPIEDLRIDHDPARAYGLVEIDVAQGAGDGLAESLRAGGWAAHR